MPTAARETHGRTLPWTETVARLVRPGGNSIDVLVEHDVSHVARETDEVGRVHVVVRVGGGSDSRWGMTKPPEEAHAEAERITTYVTDPSAEVWVEPTYRLQSHRDRRWHREEALDASPA